MHIAVDILNVSKQSITVDNNTNRNNMDVMCFKNDLEISCENKLKKTEKSKKSLVTISFIGRRTR